MVNSAENQTELTPLQKTLSRKIRKKLRDSIPVIRIFGESGSSKSLLAADLIQQSNHFDIVNIPHPRIGRRAFLVSVCTQLGVEWENGDHLCKTLYEKLKRRIESASLRGRKTLIVIDNAEGMRLPVLTALLPLVSGDEQVLPSLKLILLGRSELCQLMSLPAYSDLNQVRSREINLDSYSLIDYFNTGLHWLTFPDLRSKLSQWRQEHPVPTIKRKNLLHGLTFFALSGSLYSYIAHWQPAADVEKKDWRVVHNWNQPTSNPEELQPPTEKSEEQVVSKAERAFEEKILTGGDNSQESYRKLLALWDLNKVDLSQGSACRQIEQFQLRCQKGAAGWNYLAETKQPALLVLWPDLEDPAPRFALFHGMQEDQPLIDYGNGPVVVAKNVIEKYWSGDYLLFWRPNGPVSTLGLGSIGTEVIWLRSRLSKWDGKANNRNEVFDKDLKQRVEKFQKAHGLKPDGFAGTKTLLVLNRYNGNNKSPQLKALPKLVSRP